MKRFQSFFVVFLCMVTITGCGSSTGAPTQSEEAFPVSAGKLSSVHLCLYVPDTSGNGQVLKAVEVQAVVKEAIERTILEQQLPRLGFPTVKVLGLAAHQIKGHWQKQLVVQLSDDFFTVLSKKQNKQLLIAAMVNSLTELPGVGEVVVEAPGSDLGLATKGISSSTTVLRRDRSWFQRDKTLTPAQVLKKEMTYEQQGKWLEAYQLMSDDTENRHRKYYDDFYKELQVMKDNGFLYTDFRINGYKISKSGDKARVEVEVIPRINTSYAQYVDKVWFSTVKVENVWMVDWLTTQNR